MDKSPKEKKSIHFCFGKNSIVNYDVSYHLYHDRVPLAIILVVSEHIKEIKNLDESILQQLIRNACPKFSGWSISWNLDITLPNKFEIKDKFEF